MFPLRDNIPPRTFPSVNYAIIAACSLVFVGQLIGADGQETLVEQFGMIPVRVLHPDEPILVRERAPVMGRFGVELAERIRPAAKPPISPWLTLLTCIFLHGGWLHFLGNMWFLHIFGDNVEDRFGHVGYLLFYLGAGILASAVHLATNANSELPTIGASGAIAGVMGGYLLLYPRARVLAVVPIFVLIQIIVVPAPMFLIVWFALQFFQGTMSIGSLETGGVAWWAHIGGFVGGLGVTGLLYMAGALRPPVERVLPNTEPFQHYRLKR